MDGAAAVEGEGASSGQRELLCCVACGYDLFGIASQRCPECGTFIDWAALRTTQIPWHHRRYIGSIRAFCNTVWMMTVSFHRLAIELSRSMDPGQAIRFRRVLFVVTSIPLLATLLITAAVSEGGTKIIAPVALEDVLRSSYLSPGWMLDLSVPYALGWSALPIVALSMLAGFWLISRGGAAIRALPATLDDPERAGAARALCMYSAAPMAWLGLAGPMTALGVYLDTRMDLPPLLNSTGFYLAAAGLGLVAVSVVSMAGSSMRILYSACEKNWKRLFARSLRFVWGWILIAFFAVCVLPWILGYGYLILKSLR